MLRSKDEASEAATLLSRESDRTVSLVTRKAYARPVRICPHIANYSPNAGGKLRRQVVPTERMDQGDLHDCIVLSLHSEHWAGGAGGAGGAGQGFGTSKRVCGVERQDRGFPGRTAALGKLQRILDETVEQLEGVGDFTECVDRRH